MLRLRINFTMRQLRSASIQLALVREHQEEEMSSQQSSKCTAELNKFRGSMRRLHLEVNRSGRLVIRAEKRALRPR